MRLGIMQPYFFPYLEHFRLMAACDRWVVFDTVAYRRKTWMTRNRILDRHRGWSYVSVPVAGAGRDTPVGEVELAAHLPWERTLLDRLRVYEHHAPRYRRTVELVEEVMEADHGRLVDLNLAALEAVGAVLGIDTPIVRLTDLALDLPDGCGPGEWALHISRRLGATHYRNPVGGVDLFDPEAFAAAGIELEFHQPTDVTYPTPGFEFVPHLSILDTLMWVEADRLRSWTAPDGE